MKLRIYPKKEMVLQYFSERLEQMQARVTGINTKLEAKRASALFDPSGEAEQYAANIAQNEHSMKMLRDQIGLIHSHSPPEVMVELDY